MAQTAEMLQAHPHGTQIDEKVLADAIDTFKTCIQTCTACADACLGETEVQALIRCIRMNLDCADICQTTLSVISRQTEPSWRTLRAQLQVCATASQDCAEECEKHAAHHEHCRICAEACRKCEEACQSVMAVLPA